MGAREVLGDSLKGFLKFSVLFLLPVEILRIFDIGVVPRIAYVPIAALFVILEVLRGMVKGTVGQPILSAMEYLFLILLFLSRGTVVSRTMEIGGVRYEASIGVAPLFLTIIMFIIVPAMILSFVDWATSEEV